MKPRVLRISSFAASLTVAAAVLLSPTTSRANVYATDIKVGGILTNGAVAVPEAGATAITYILNESATLGVSISIQAGGTNTRTITISSAAGASGKGTSRGTNLVVWDGNDLNGSPAPTGTYSLSITAAATGYTVWTQTSVDSNPGNYNYYPHGIAVDNNTNSPYYGRVLVGCSLSGGVNPVTGGANMDGIYKQNADGSPADEGNFGYGGYSTDDKGNVSTLSGQMPDASDVVPYKLRIGSDDRAYMLDWSAKGAVVAFDMLVSTNQIVFNSVNIASNPDASDLTYGIDNFDVTAGGTTNAALWLCDADYPNWGIWEYHMTNGAADPNDAGTQAVFAGSGSSMTLVSSGGCMIDTNLDIFTGQNRNNTNDANNRSMVFSNWNGGILPPEGTGFTDADLTAAWAVGASDNNFEQVVDTVINSRTSPTIVACPMENGASYVSGKTAGGIRLLNAATGVVVTVTNGSTVTTYTNIDTGEIYTCAAWDNVGNLYAASTTRNVWRVYSPPGANTNTTTAVELLSVQPLPPTASLAVSSFSGNGNTNATPITASFDGTAPLRVQWYYINPVNNTTNAVAGQIENTTEVSTTLALSNLVASDNGNEYFLVVSNSLGAATTSVATLTVYTTPQITSNLTPLTQTENAGTMDTFSVGAVGSVPLSYQWYLNGTAVPAQTNSSFSFIVPSGSSTVYATVYNSAGTSVNTSTATVTGSLTGLPVYEPFTEYASLIGGSNAFDLCSAGLTVPSGDSSSALTWGSLNYSGLGLNAAGSVGIDVLVTNNSSTPFTQAALASLLPSTFPGFPASSISVMAVNPSQPGAAANTVGNSAVLVLANDFTRPASGTKTLYISYLISFAQKGQLGTGNDGRYLAFLASSNIVEPASPYSYWGNLFNTFGGSPRYVSHGLFDISTTSAYIAPCDCSAGKEFSSSLYTAPLGNNSPSGAPIFVVGAYTFSASGSDANSMWVNPVISSFGGANPPGSPQNDVMPSGYNMTDIGGICLLDRIGSGGSGGVGTNFIANLLVGTTWSYVTGGPEFTVQPMSVAGSSATLTANAVAAGQTVSYQWQHVTATATNNVNNGAGGAGGSATVSGATSSTLTLSGMSSVDGGSYQVVATASSTGYTLTSTSALVVAPATSPAPTPVAFASTPISGAPNAPVLHFSGTAGHTYHVWSTTNVALTPVETKWTLIGTGTFSGGADTFSCPASGNATEFYTITQP